MLCRVVVVGTLLPILSGTVLESVPVILVPFQGLVTSVPDLPSLSMMHGANEERWKLATTLRVFAGVRAVECLDTARGYVHAHVVGPGGGGWTPAALDYEADSGA
jgi:hypothetical protein